MKTRRSTPDAGDLTPSSLDFPVVGLGASAGGLPALQRFLEAMPPDCGMAFVVILHLSSEHASEAHTVLQRSTRMKVEQVTGPRPIEPGHVYVIPPSKQLSMNDGYLRVSDYERPLHKHVAIDLFFRTLAEVHRERAFGIVLSGTGSDGAVGIAKIREQGGVTFAQASADAEFDDMPRAAIATGAIDWVLPVAEMPGKLLDLWANARAIELPQTGPEELPGVRPLGREAAREAEEALREIMLLVRLRTGNDFRHYKRATLLRRIERRLQVNGMPTLPAYRTLLQEQPEEARALLDDLLIGVTNFFRDREAFESLEHGVVPRLFEPGPQGQGGAVRAWVAGCSSGEEAYTVAMLLAGQAQSLPQPPDLQVFATDIDEHAIAVARAGLYPESIAVDVAPERLRQFFNKEGCQYRVRKELREHILFAVHNLLRDPPFSKLDLISCRNLLIYLDRAVHTQILEMFHFALRPGGYLLLGSSESADAASQLFTVVDKKNRIYRANELAHPTRYSTTLPVGLFESKPAGPREPAADHRRVSYAEVHRRLAEQHAPPSVLVDAESNIVHLSEQAGRFLRHAGGTPSHQLLALVLAELRLELRTALFQALQSGRSVEARRVKLEGEERSRYVNMTVRPVTEPALGAPLALVLFAEVEETLGPEAGGDGEVRDPLVAHLEEELKRTKEQLQQTIEQAETSTEELKASNEELQAINEELRSATEELETSKEELQSINEELITVNHELKAKVEETGKINDDLQNLIASTDIATVFIDRAMSIKRYTPRATDLFSLIPTDVGRSLLDIRHRLDYEQLADDATAAFQSLRLIEREVASRDGRWYLARMLPYRTTEDRIDGAVLTFIDVTGRRQAEERLREGERRMRLVAESTRDYAIITLDPEGRITTWNKGAEGLFGHTEAQALGQPVAMLYPPEERGGDAAADEMRHARDEGRAEDNRWHIRRDGRRVFCSGVTTPLYIDGRLQGYAKIARDLTDAKRHEHEREVRLAHEEAGRAEAQAASDMKDEFLAILSHELKNPLNLIQMNAELLARLPETRQAPAVRTAAATIRETVRSQAQIIDDLLDLSRLNTGKLALACAAVDLGAVAGRIVEALSPDAHGKGIALRLEAPPAPLVLDADAVRVEQIVWNLLSNALKFTPAGGEVVVRLAAEPGFGRLEVSDTGRGIEPEFLPRIFDMFQQAEARSTRREGGLGIGLALVRQLAQAHGGRVEASSEGPGRGSRFVVQLPLHAGGPAPAAQASADGHEFEGLRVLLVDDDRAAAQTLAHLLELEGMAVTTAFDAWEALHRCEAQDFDLLVSDIAMPGMDGHQLVATLRASPRHARLPALALTGFGRAADVERALAAGFDRHLGKPVALEQLLQALRALRLHRRPHAPGRPPQAGAPS